MQRTKITIMLLTALPLMTALNGCSKRQDADEPQVMKSVGETGQNANAEEFPTRPFFGDTHLHTSYSADAGMAGKGFGHHQHLGQRKEEVDLRVPDKEAMVLRDAEVAGDVVDDASASEPSGEDDTDKGADDLPTLTTADDADQDRSET